MNIAGRHEAVAGTIARDARRAETARREADDIIEEIYMYTVQLQMSLIKGDKTGRSSYLIVEVICMIYNDVPTPYRLRTGNVLDPSARACTSTGLL